MNSKVRIRYKDLELELEGREEFVMAEAEKLLNRTGVTAGEPVAALNKPRNNEGAALMPALERPSLTQSSSPLEAREALWKKVTEPHLKYRGLWNLRYAARRDKEGVAQAALALLTAHRELERKPAMTALELMRTLKASGFNPSRLDTHLKILISRGFILASGSRRARRYEVTNQGLNEALRLAYELYPNLVA